MIKDRNLTAGTKLVGRYKKQDHTCEVVDKDGKLHFKVDAKDDQVFKSPSASGTAVTGHACDGWTFWTLATESADTEPQVVHPLPYEEVKPAIDAFRESIAKTHTKDFQDKTAAEVKAQVKADKPKPPKTGVYRLPNQKGAPAGLTRYYCFDCSSPFPVKSDIKNPACPNCHPAK